MAGDYIPHPDGESDAWQASFVTYASANAAVLGLDPVAHPPPGFACCWSIPHLRPAGVRIYAADPGVTVVSAR